MPPISGLILSSAPKAVGLTADPSAVDYYNSLQQRFVEFETVWLPVIVILFFFLVALFLWLICWACSEWDDEETPRLQTTGPAVINPVVVDNVIHQHMVSVQTVSEDSAPKKKKAQKQRIPRPINRLSTGFSRKKVKKQSIRANDSKKASINVKNESHLESNAKNKTIRSHSIDDSEKIAIDDE